MVIRAPLLSGLEKLPENPTGRDLAARETTEQGLTKREYMLARIVPALIRATPNVLWKNNGETRNNMPLFDLDDTAVEELVLEAEDIVDRMLAK